MRISHEDHGSTSLVALAGEFLDENTDSFVRCISERFDAGVRNIVLDMTGLESIDSAGLESLLWTLDESTSRSGRLKLVGSSGTVAEAFRVTRLVRRFDFEETVEEAARSLR
jgi:anti-anti-sigma factor